jgi:hypothetical protein
MNEAVDRRLKRESQLIESLAGPNRVLKVRLLGGKRLVRPRQDEKWTFTGKRWRIRG